MSQNPNNHGFVDDLGAGSTAVDLYRLDKHIARLLVERGYSIPATAAPYVHHGDAQAVKAWTVMSPVKIAAADEERILRPVRAALATLGVPFEARVCFVPAPGAAANALSQTDRQRLFRLAGDLVWRGLPPDKLVGAGSIGAALQAAIDHGVISAETFDVHRAAIEGSWDAALGVLWALPVWVPA